MRIERVRSLTPPPKGRRARKGYASKDDFAGIVGVSRSRMYAWTREKRPEYPEEQHQVRLAELSGGLYAPEDFQRPGGPMERPDRLEELVATVGDLLERQVKTEKELARLRSRLHKLEARPAAAEAAPKRPRDRRSAAQ